MTQRQCASCDNPAPDTLTICARCIRQTRRRLGDMEALRQELEVAMTRQVRMQADNDGGRSANQPLAYDQRAADLLHDQRAILVAWCKLIHDEISNTWPLADTIMAMSMQIEFRLGDLAKHEAVGELVEELWDLEDRIMAAIDTPEDKTRTYVGPCPTVLDDDIRCPGEVTLHQPAMYADCQECETRWEGMMLNRLGVRLLNRNAYGTTPEIAGLYGIPEPTIRRWVSEGKLTRMPNKTIALAEVDKVCDMLGIRVA